MKMSSRNILLTFLAGCFFSLLVYLPYYARYEGNIGISIGMNKERVNCLARFDQLPQDLPIYDIGKGFDSGDYYLIALDPFFKKRPVCVEGNLNYNSQRYLYHLFISALGLGDPTGVMIAGPLLNILCLALSLVFWKLSLQHLAMPLWLAWPFTFQVGTWFGFRFNSSENLVFMLLSLSFWLFLKSKYWSHLITLVIAVFARNVVLGWALCASLQRFFERPKEFGRNLLLVLAPWAGYKFFLMPLLIYLMGADKIETGMGYLVLPLAKVVHESSQYFANGEYLRFMLAWSAVFYLFCLCLVAFWHFVKFRFERIALVAAVVGYSLVLLSIENSGWGNGPLHTLRIIAIVVPLGFILLYRLVSYQTFCKVMGLNMLYSLWGPIWLWLSPKVSTVPLADLLGRP